ncbi:MAG: hypothetical protein FWG08_02410 [Propionibacteriaceae bacterium]|nr:hypothetical protein [Propionibacteriaceae bacterium]
MAHDRVPDCTHARPHNHGNYLTYQVHHCKCSLCRSAWSKRVQADNFKRYQGRSTYTPVTEELLAHLDHLLEYVPKRVLADRLGISHATLVRIHSRTKLKSSMVDEITALSLGMFNTCVGAQRRIQALCLAGYPLSFLATHSGVKTRMLTGILANEPHKIVIYDRIQEVFDRLWDQPPETMGVTNKSANKTRRWASKQNWYPALAWDDDTINDPESLPAGVDEDRFRFIDQVEDLESLLAQGLPVERAIDQSGWDTLDKFIRECYSHNRLDLVERASGADSDFGFSRRIENLEFLLDCGTPITEALQRCGWIKWDSFQKSCKRHGRRDLVQQLSVKLENSDRHWAEGLSWSTK